MTKVCGPSLFVIWMVSVTVSSRAAVSFCGELNGADHAAKSRLTCGHRAALSFVHAAGFAREQELAKIRTITRADGVSLLDIANSLNIRGRICEMRQLSPSELRSNLCPILVHLKSGHAGTNIGHFVVLLAVGNDGLTIVEPIVGRRENWSWGYFSDRWTGNCILALQRPNSESLLLAALFTVNCGLLMWWVIAHGFSVPGRAVLARTFKFSVRTLLVSVFWTPPECFADDPMVRSARRDGTNAAWLIASLANERSQERDLPRLSECRTVPSTFAEIRALCAEWTTFTDLRRLTYSEFCSLPGAAVVFLRDGPEATGYFAVTLRGRDQEVTMINAGWLTISVLTEDQFRERWSGHALIPRRASGEWSLTAICGSLLGLIFALAIIRRRRV